MVDSFVLSRSVAAWYFVTQAAASVGVRISNAALALSALAGVKAAGSPLRLWLHSEPEHENKEHNKTCLKNKAKRLPGHGDQGFSPRLPRTA
jgi:hypothetical protein